MSVEIKPICLVFFLPTLLFAQDTDIPDFLKFDTTLYGKRNNGVALNSINYSNNGPSECLSNYPKPDDKNQNRESCDFWWKGYVSWDKNKTPNDKSDDISLIHTGADFQVGDNSDHVDIGSFSYGLVKQAFYEGSKSSPGYVTVEQLLDSGETVFVNYYHLDNKSRHGDEAQYPTVNSEGHIVRGQLLGKEGNTGLFIENWDSSTHLHLDFSNKVKSALIYTANACSSDSSACELSNSESFMKDDLIFYYDKTKVNSVKRVFYNPDIILRNKKALIPVVYSREQEGVRKRLYGYVGEPTETSLFFNRKSKKEFDSVSVLYERHTEEHKRNRKITRYYAPNEFNVALARQDIPKGDTNDNRSIAIEQADDYLFVAYLKSGKNESKSYPVIFSVLNPSEFIVDNDQTNYGGGNKFGEEAFSVSGKSHRVPGYYLTAEDLQEDASAFWRPNRRGRFTAQVFVPENMNAGAQDYQICNKIDVCEPVFSELQPVTPETHFRWLSETSPPISLDASTFIVTSGDNDPSTTVLADAIKFSYSSVDIELIRTHLGIPLESIAAHYIVKHYMELDSPRVIDTEDGNVHSFIVHENKNEYAVYQLGKKAIGIDTSTHRIKLLNCSISTKWDASIHSFLRKIGIGSCEGR